MARYDAYHLTQLKASGQLRPFVGKIIDRNASVYRKVILMVPAASVALLIATLILVVR